MQVATSTPVPTVNRAIFRRGVRLVVSYVRMHPKPFAAAVAGAVLFAFASLWLTEALARATDEVLAPAFDGDLDTSKVWLAVGGLMLGGIGRALGIMVRRYYSGVAGERVMATLRTRVAERYRALAALYRETPTGELLAHMEADVKAAVDVFWPVPFAMGVIVLDGAGPDRAADHRPGARARRTVRVPDARDHEPDLRPSHGRADPTCAGTHRGGQRRRARIDRRRARREDARQGAGRDPAPLRAGAGAPRRARALDRSARPSRPRSTPCPPSRSRCCSPSDRGACRRATSRSAISIGFVALFQLLAWPMRFIGWILAESPRAVVGYDRIEEVFRAGDGDPGAGGRAAARGTAGAGGPRPAARVRAGLGARGRDL